MKKVLTWLIALLGIWEFGDIAALLVPGFGKLSTFLWNHIIAGMILILVSAWAALTSNAQLARRLLFIAAAAGLWLIVASFSLRDPVAPAGLWNDVIVGALASLLGLLAAHYDHH